jgi:hypothetical protein
MSTRGGYGFTLNNKDVIVYTGGGAELEGLGETVLQFLRATDIAKIKKQVLGLKEVSQGNMVTDDDVNVIRTKTGIVVGPQYGHPVTTWFHLLYPGRTDPKYILDAGKYIDGSWIIGSVDLEFYYHVDFDKGVLEVYHGYRRPNTTKGRFEAPEWTTRASARYENLPTLLVTYPLDNLPANMVSTENALYS